MIGRKTEERGRKKTVVCIIRRLNDACSTDWSHVILALMQLSDE